jgi:bifunctional N-acetylglucosamine-1-phosphate-uridyltransferase/glucosamine-1-phosphate-acetyltransferase GlmU-like protein
MAINQTARIEASEVGDAAVREYATLHDAEVGDGARIDERTTVEQSTIAGPADGNANAYLENVRVEPTVQVGPSSA